MNRKERLKIVRTPDASLIRDDFSSTGPFTSPQKYINKRRAESKPRSSSIKNVLISIRAFLPYFVFMALYTIIMFFVLRPSNDKPLLAVLMDELEKLKNENGELLNTIENTRVMVYQNYAKAEMGTKVMVDEDLMYKYGFIGFRKHNDPSVIFNDGNWPGDCLAFNGSRGKFTVVLKNLAYITKIGFYHPNLKNNTSAMREFAVRGYKDSSLVKESVFEFVGRGFEEFSVGEFLGDKLEIEILNNHGNKKYTCIYKVVIIGHESQT